jgi:membrane protease YdiL (CAAX protease family)
LGGLWVITDNLLVPAVVHALYDFWALIYLLKIHRNRG